MRATSRSFQPAWAFAALALGVLLVGAAARPGGDPTVLTVFAAASLTDAFNDAGAQFQKRHPGLKLRFNYAGSQQLALQIAQGAGADVFASADERWMSAVRDSGLVDGEPGIFARNRLVVIAPGSNPGRVDRLQDLARRGLKLVLAADAVPVGRYTRQALDKMSQSSDFGSDFSRRVLKNVVSQEDNVKAVATKVQLGEADAGIVYRSDVTPAVLRLVRVIEIPADWNVIASYPIAVLRDSRSAEAARSFVRFILSPEGQGILERHGLMRAESSLGAALTEPAGFGVPAH